MLLDLRILIIVAAGAFSLAGAVLNWDWFMNARKAQFFVRRFGRNGARAFYAILGIALMTLGIGMGLGIVPTKGRAAATMDDDAAP